ncbi:hypothetical protein B0J11DRAFT_577026 [Dendryphion nanum]|uniref:MARVEL domain-containing protein n=1 Tax=Dendryphion nanum TaxID=256645 RepID=A0A9P9IV99_9PLEO|nr:hypothetical protein B0J11DRAFT_577026 [Dendryphion nanum]
MAFGLRGGAVQVPRWILILRAFQLFFAILILCLVAYALSVDRGGPLQPPLISTIIIAALTIVPILVLVTPLHLAQRKIYDPRIALLLDGFAMLWWLATFAALASYQNIYRYWGREFKLLDIQFEVCGRCRRAWRVGVASTVFSVIQFLLFLFSTLIFIYYYHCQLSGHPAPGIQPKTNSFRGPTDGRSGCAAGVAGAAGPTGSATTGIATNGTPTGTTAHIGEQHPLKNLSSQGRNGPVNPTTNGQQSNPPYLTGALGSPGQSTDCGNGHAPGSNGEHGEEQGRPI